MGVKIRNLTAMTDLASGDSFVVAEDNPAATKQITYTNLLSNLNSDLTIPDGRPAHYTVSFGSSGWVSINTNTSPNGKSSGVLTKEAYHPPGMPSSITLSTTSLVLGGINSGRAKYNSNGTMYHTKEPQYGQGMVAVAGGVNFINSNGVGLIRFGTATTGTWWLTFLVWP